MLQERLWKHRKLGINTVLAPRRWIVGEKNGPKIQKKAKMPWSVRRACFYAGWKLAGAGRNIFPIPSWKKPPDACCPGTKSHSGNDIAIVCQSLPKANIFCFKKIPSQNMLFKRSPTGTDPILQSSWKHMTGISFFVEFYVKNFETFAMKKLAKTFGFPAILKTRQIFRTMPFKIQ